MEPSYTQAEVAALADGSGGQSTQESQCYSSNKIILQKPKIMLAFSIWLY
jgi:hypothetical protein